MEFAIQIITFIIGIAVLIFIHELGHFLAARLLKVEVEEFGIGFPPRVVKLFEHKGTIFSLNAIPLGGFVRPKGENDPNVPGGLAAASPWVRLGVLVAGPLMNLITGVVLGVLLFYSLGESIPEKVLITEIAPSSPAETAGLTAGDLVLTVDGIQIDSVDKLRALVDERLDRPLIMVVQRGEEVVTLSMTPRSAPPPGQGALGVVLGNPTRPIGLATAVRRGADAAYQNVRGLLLLPMRLMSGNTAPGEARVVGYKGMFDIYQRIPNPLYFFMAISISLGIMNLLPIPALDGGRILLTLPEILIRRRVPAHYENMIHMVGFIALILLLIYVNLQDFINPIQLP